MTVDPKSASMESAASMGSTSTSGRSKFPPKPVVDRIVKSPYESFGSIEDMTPPEEAVQGEESAEPQPKIALGKMIRD
jgi:hypothetical protein